MNDDAHQIRQIRCNRELGRKVSESVKGKTDITRKNIPVEIWMTVNFPVVPRVIVRRWKPEKRLIQPNLPHQIPPDSHRRFTIL